MPSKKIAVVSKECVACPMGTMTQGICQVKSREADKTRKLVHILKK
jgi:hypothetical protein